MTGKAKERLPFIPGQGAHSRDGVLRASLRNAAMQGPWLSEEPRSQRHAQCTESYLDLRQDGHHRHHNAEDQVKADQHFAFCAAVWFRVVDIEQHHSSNGACIEEEGEDEEC